MRSLRLAAAILALTLVAAACSDDGETDEEPSDAATTTTPSASPTISQPRVTPPTTVPVDPPTTTVVELVTTTSTTEPPEGGTTSGPPNPPSNVRCRAGTAENELLVEFDALPDPSNISKIRTYLQVDDGPVLTNSEFTVSEVDTTRDGGDRWAARVRRVPANTPVKLYATSFNQLGQESGWYGVGGLYTGAGAPCGTPLPPATCTAGCDEEEGEPGA